MTSQVIKVAIADDNREFIDVLEEYISREPDIELVGKAHNGEKSYQLLNQNIQI